MSLRALPWQSVAIFVIPANAGIHALKNK